MTRSALPRAFRSALAILIALAFGLGASTTAGAAPSDPGQWYLATLHIPQAQAITTGTGVTVAVIDTGIDDTHPALAGQTVSGKCFGAARFVEPTDDSVGHGTAMAGLIAGTGKDSRHILGIAPGAKLMPLCINADHVTDDAAINTFTPAIRYAVDHGANVISMSVGADDSTTLAADTAAYHAAVAYALRHNVVIVAAVGNKPLTGKVVSPARLPGVIGVTGTTRSGGAWSGSADGTKVLAAPATDILSTDTLHKADADNRPVHSDGYVTGSGTSNSTAIVAGVAALVRAKYPNLDAANVVNRLIRTADHKGAAGRNDQYGYGIVDPVKALTADVPKVDANPLGEPAAPSASTSPTNGGGRAGSTTGTGGTSPLPWIVLGVVVLVAAVVIVVLLSRRRARGSTAGRDRP
ncbi:MAG TPA: S8 family serine peptidase [Actinocatenispora sp.]